MKLQTPGGDPVDNPLNLVHCFPQIIGYITYNIQIIESGDICAFC